MAAVDRAESAVRTLILRGELAPGGRLGEVELAGSLGMSRTPVREALRRLSSQGLVEIAAHRGARVTRWPDAELERVFALRAALESMAAASAARLATPEQVERLDQLARGIEAACFPAATRCWPQITELNTAFHQSLLEIDGSSSLAQAMSGLVHASVLTRTQQAYDEDALRRSANHHLEIVAAVRARDPEWARSVMTSHLLAARAALLGRRHHDSTEAP